MTLDPVHFEGIAELVGGIDHDIDDSDYRDFANTVWNEFLDPLTDADGRVVLEPLDSVKRRRADIEQVALQDDEFPTRHGLDSGTMNPLTFKNGIVLDVAHAAMAATPSDLDLHRARTVVAAVHSNDGSFDATTDWERFDGYSRRRRVHAPRVRHYEEAVVHALALYLAESRHALSHADAVEDLLVLDGPIYPKGMLQWLDRRPELGELVLEDDELRRVLSNYVELVETFVERDVPLTGFVKNMSSKAITQTVGASGRTGRTTPWAHDAAFFSQVLERRERVDGEFERLTDELTFTNWFVSRVGSDRLFGGERNELSLDRGLDPSAYELTFCIVYDPRTDLVYKIEAPYAFTRDEETRRRIERQLLKDVAVRRGPPIAVGKADELARIRRNERGSLASRFERVLDSEVDGNYDAERWAVR